MSIVAGNLLALSVDHDELGSRSFDLKSGEDATYMTGGYKSTDDDGNTTSALQRIDVLNAFPWSLETTLGGNNGDADFLQALSENPLEGSWTATFMDLTVRVGSGKPVGDVAENKQSGTIALKLAGSGRFEEIS